MVLTFPKVVDVFASPANPSRVTSHKDILRRPSMPLHGWRLRALMRPGLIPVLQAPLKTAPASHIASRLVRRRLTLISACLAQRLKLHLSALQRHPAGAWLHCLLQQTPAGTRGQLVVLFHALHRSTRPSLTRRDLTIRLALNVLDRQHHHAKQSGGGCDPCERPGDRHASPSP